MLHDEERKKEREKQNKEREKKKERKINLTYGIYKYFYGRRSHLMTCDMPKIPRNTI